MIHNIFSYTFKQQNNFKLINKRKIYLSFVIIQLLCKMFAEESPSIHREKTIVSQKQHTSHN